MVFFTDAQLVLDKVIITIYTAETKTNAHVIVKVLWWQLIHKNGLDKILM
jgi:hypothetical protein